VIYFSLIEIDVRLSPNYTVFIIFPSLSAWHGWGVGVGASLAMEARRCAGRGILSGILQVANSIGYLLAAVAAGFSCPCGMRPMFGLGTAALLALYIPYEISAGVGGVEAASRCEHRHRFCASLQESGSALRILLVLMTS